MIWTVSLSMIMNKVFQANLTPPFKTISPSTLNSTVESTATLSVLYGQKKQNLKSNRQKISKFKIKQQSMHPSLITVKQFKHSVETLNWKFSTKSNKLNNYALSSTNSKRKIYSKNALKLIFFNMKPIASKKHGKSFIHLILTTSIL